MCQNVTISSYGQPGNFTQTGTSRKLQPSRPTAPCSRSATTARGYRSITHPGPRRPLFLLLLLWSWAQVPSLSHAGYYLNTIEGRVVDDCHLQMLRRGDVGYLPQASEGGGQGLDFDTEEEELYAHPRSLIPKSRKKRLLVEFPKNSIMYISILLVMPAAIYNAGNQILYWRLNYIFVIRLPTEVVTYLGMRDGEHYHHHHHLSYNPPTIVTTRAPSFAVYKAPPAAPAPAAPAPAPAPAAPSSSYSTPPKSGKSVDAQRLAGFMALETMLDSAGMPGRWCVLKAVCEVAAEPLKDLGIMGEMVNLFLAAGYGEGSEVMLEYSIAEEIGLSDGDCAKHFAQCPTDLAFLLEKGVGMLNQGLGSAALQGDHGYQANHSPRAPGGNNVYEYDYTGPAMK